MRIELRPVTEADRPLLFQLYASTREFELSQVPWSPEQKQAFLEMQFAAQTRSYSSTYSQATHEMICLDGEPVGRLYLDRIDRYHILDITIAPAHRSKGIGSEILRRILAEAHSEGKTVSIYTETFNPSLRLFVRLGFRQKSVDGFLVLLEKPTSEAAAPSGD
jgi:RimJ/RimL family protein N-acetyltransferase